MTVSVLCLQLLARQPLEHYVQLHRVNKAIPHKPRRFRLCSCWTCPQYTVHVLDTLCLCSIRYACPQYAVPVLDTLCLSSLRCACAQYVVPVLNTLCPSYKIACACPRYALPVLDRLCLS